MLVKVEKQMDELGCQGKEFLDAVRGYIPNDAVKISVCVQDTTLFMVKIKQEIRGQLFQLSLLYLRVILNDPLIVDVEARSIARQFLGGRTDAIAKRLGPEARHAG